MTTIGLLIVVTLLAFEAMSVAAALPTAARDLHGLAWYGWAFSGFVMANILGLVISGMLSDRRGPRRPLVAGLTLFPAGLLLAGGSRTMTQLIEGRIVQGLGSGLILTAIYVILGECYPTAIRPRMFAAISTAWVLPSLIGPPLAGFVTQHLGWRWVFLGLVPLTVLGALLMVPVLRTMSDAPRPGVVTNPGRLVRAVAVAAGLTVLIRAGQQPGPRWILPAAVAAGGLVWGLRRLLPPGTFQVRPGVGSTVALRGLLAGAMFGTESLIPLSLSVQHGFRPTAAALPLLGAALAWTLGSWWQGRDAIGDTRPTLIRIGFGLLVAACLGAAVASLPAGPAALMYPAWLLAGLAAGLSMSSFGVLLLDATTDADRGRDSSALQLADAVAQAVTTGLAGILLAAAAGAVLTYTQAFVAVDVSMAAIALLGVLLAGRTRTVPRPAPALP